MPMYNSASQQKVIEALAWAYRNGYCFAESAAQEFAQANGLKLVKIDLGTYGDTIGFEVAQ